LHQCDRVKAIEIKILAQLKGANNGPVNHNYACLYRSGCAAVWRANLGDMVDQ
jgi:hypothetical protein